MGRSLSRSVLVVVSDQLVWWPLSIIEFICRAADRTHVKQNFPQAASQRSTIAKVNGFLGTTGTTRITTHNPHIRQALGVISCCILVILVIEEK